MNDKELHLHLKKYNWSGDADYQLAFIAFKEIAKSRDQQIALAAQQNAVAWAVGVIDQIHFNITGDDDDSDPIFKGIKNTLRDRYKEEVGIDPAPSYPVNATLKAQEKHS